MFKEGFACQSRIGVSAVNAPVLTSRTLLDFLQFDDSSRSEISGQ
jgi:hypothetical protein